MQHIQDFWGDPLTAAGAQSADGKAVYVQLNLTGNQGETRSNASVDAVRKIVDGTPRRTESRPTSPVRQPSQPTETAAATRRSSRSWSPGHVNFVMLLFVYRSIVTGRAAGDGGYQLAAARGIVAFLSLHDVIKLSTSPPICWCRWRSRRALYGIFFIGRYHERDKR